MVKKNKADVDYTDDGTDAEHCSICTHYSRILQQGVCARVVGPVAARGWCKLFKKE